jgi:hypothetical protein
MKRLLAMLAVPVSGAIRNDGISTGANFRRSLAPRSLQGSDAPHNAGWHNTIALPCSIVGTWAAKWRLTESSITLTKEHFMIFQPA